MLENKEIHQRAIDEFLLKFMARLLKEIYEGKRNHMDLGDGFGIGISQAKKKGYKLSKEIQDFLMRLSSYGMQNIFGHGDSPYGEVFENPEEVEKELKRIAKKLKIPLN